MSKEHLDPTANVYPAYGVSQPALFKKRPADAKLITPEQAILGTYKIKPKEWISIDCAGLGHTPEGRGRVVDTSWLDYCRTTEGKICYGPYITLAAGVWEWCYELRFSVPNCGGATDDPVFTLDTTQYGNNDPGDPGRTIPGSPYYWLRWSFMCQNADANNVFSGLWGGRFAIAYETRGVEMRFGNVRTQLGGFFFEIQMLKLYFQQVETI